MAKCCGGVGPQVVPPDSVEYFRWRDAGERFYDSGMTTADRDYVLGTHDEEVSRLGLQHRVWRNRVQESWDRAGLGPGSRVLDVGAGPGFATFDLAERVGPAGHVFAVERSRRFLDILDHERVRRGVTQISTHELDVDTDALPASGLDAAWCRWVFAFVREPEALVREVLSSLRPSGMFVAYEYLNYETWKLIPQVPSFEEFVNVVMATWRDQGGEPNIGRDLPRWCEAAGAKVVSLRPIMDVVTPADAIWEWPESFLHVGLDRLVALGHVTPTRAEDIRRDFDEHKARQSSRMSTPVVIEVMAQVKSSGLGQTVVRQR
jgi:SAM-dependent methyltransferase